MRIEIEAKMLLADPAALEDRLRAVGAKKGPEFVQVNTFFDTGDATLKTSDRGLRLRVEQEPDGSHQTITITHKGPRAHGQLKSRWETELVVNDAQAAAQLLTALGYTAVFSFEKRRRCWELDKCQVVLDELPLLGWYVEIEGPSDEAVMAVRERLGLGSVPLIHASYVSILSTYLAEHRQSGEHVRFEHEAPATP